MICPRDKEPSTIGSEMSVTSSERSKKGEFQWNTEVVCDKEKLIGLTRLEKWEIAKEIQENEPGNH